MKERITAAELKAMTMKELAAWVEFNACAINRTMVMSWGHEELFKEYHIRPEYIGYKAGRLIVKAFHFTSRTRKADAQSFAEWLHWAIFGEYPAEETAEQAEETEETETEPAAPSAPSANEETAAPTETQTTDTDTEEEEEEQTMNTNAKKYSFEIRQIDALNYGEDEGWIWNTSYNMGEMTTKAQNERKAFTSWLKNHCGISFKPNRTLIEFDGDCYTIIDRKTKEPLFIAIPNY